MAKNAFDELLASVADEADRKALGEIAEKHPNLKEAVMLRSDYSRRQDELKAERDKLRAETDLAAEWQKWRAENWVDNAFGDGKGATKRELERFRESQTLQEKVQQLEQQVGVEVTFDDLNKHLDRVMLDRKLATQPEIEKLVNDKASGVEEFVKTNLAGYAHLATNAPRLAIRHYKDFNEELDVDGLVKFAVDNKHTDMGKAYDEMVGPRRKEREQKEFDEKLKAAEEKGRTEALKERGMSPGSMPVDSGGPEMGHFQRKILGIQDTPEGGIKVEGDPQLGRGTLAAVAARNWDKESAGKTS